MLFNSFNFIFYFLPIAIFSYVLFILSRNTKYFLLSFSILSLFFYAYWNWKYVFLIITSIIFNYLISIKISENIKKNKYLIIGIFGNLLILSYFKYTNFIIENINLLTNFDIQSKNIALPLAISFFTFQQIGYLSDLRNNKIKKNSFYNYFLFVTFFPQLIAGPIVKNSEFIPQLKKITKTKKIFIKNFIKGSSLFIIGIFKKNFLADNLEKIATPIFDSSLSFSQINFFEQWIGLLAYSFQIYFDFSAYSDMAIGLALIFGFKFPFNFNSPYKSSSIIEFWKKWHITLSRFINEYLFNFLSLWLFRKNFFNFKNVNNTFVNIFISAIITFSISGLWHGPSWNFILWGFLHGIYIYINFIYKNYINNNTNFNLIFYKFLTFLCVIIAWVPFRSQNLEITKNYYLSLLGVNSNFNFNFNIISSDDYFGLLILFISFIICFIFKNSNSFFKNHKNFFTLNFDYVSGLKIFIILILIIFFGLKKAEPFIYFQF
tara:strand:+ start:6861 stop:8330 length:1470 start_codon:yes stop_codon:yes gene_type:complete